jgi:hypothetical protein
MRGSGTNDRSGRAWKHALWQSLWAVARNGGRKGSAATYCVESLHEKFSFGMRLDASQPPCSVDKQVLERVPRILEIR